MSDGGPAFPRLIRLTSSAHEFTPQYDGGMSLRDYFAGQVINGMWANPDPNFSQSRDDQAAEAYRVADAMIKARTEVKP